MNKKRSVLPYGDSTLSPPIKSTENEVTVWKEMQKDESNKYFDTKYQEILEEMKELKDAWEVDKWVKNAEITFKPEIGISYYAYERTNGTKFISLIAPTEWDIKKYNITFLDTVKINSKGTWTNE
tara:strand:- start:47 stop:421 length:375 start_codon:yes stop_codon:yes gene_type:complete